MHSQLRIFLLNAYVKLNMWVLLYIKQDDCIINPTIVYCGIELFNKFSDRLTLAISSKTTTELDDVMKVNVEYHCYHITTNVTGFTKTVLIGTRNEIQFIADY